MSLALQTVLDDVEHALSGPLHSSLSATRIVNDAGQYLVSMHDWKWLERPAVELNLRGTITLSNATWTTATLTITKTAAFADYSFLEGDRIEIEDGTNAVLGFYEIAGRTSDDAITLKTDIGATTGSTDIDATIELPSVALPSDFAELLHAPTARSSLLGSMLPTSLSEVLLAREALSSVSSTDYMFAISHGAGPTAGGPPVPRLELDHSPTANDTASFKLFYRAGWPAITGEGSTGLTEQIIPIPEWLEFPFRQLVRAMALGYEESDVKDMTTRIGEVLPLFEAAKKRDGMVQNSYGRMTGGVIARQMRVPGDFFSRSTVGDPA